MKSVDSNQPPKLQQQRKQNVGLLSLFKVNLPLSDKFKTFPVAPLPAVSVFFPAGPRLRSSAQLCCRPSRVWLPEVRTKSPRLQSSSDRRLRAKVRLNVHHKPNGRAAAFRVLGTSDQSKTAEKSIKERPTSE